MGTLLWAGWLSIKFELNMDKDIFVHASSTVYVNYWNLHFRWIWLKNSAGIYGLILFNSEGTSHGCFWTIKLNCVQICMHSVSLKKFTFQWFKLIDVMNCNNPQYYSFVKHCLRTWLLSNIFNKTLYWFISFHFKTFTRIKIL